MKLAKWVVPMYKLWLAAGLIVIVFAAVAAQAQSYTILHSFTRGQDGASPLGGLTIDAGGSLYGTASSGGAGNSCLGGCGTVFKLSQRNSSWTLSPLYLFNQSDGAVPEARLSFGPDGRLYGTTGQGGTACNSPGCGVVFALRPPATFCHSVTCYWSEQVLYQFAGGNDGSPRAGLRVLLVLVHARRLRVLADRA